MGSTFGQLFRVTTFGESHGGGVGVVVDGCPPRLPLDGRGDPARSRPAPARAEQHHHAARRGRSRRDPLRRLRGADARHADRHPGAQHRRAAERPTRTSRTRTAPRTPTTPTRRSTASAIGRAADAPRRARPSAASPPAPIARKLLATVANVEVLAYVRQVWTIDADDRPAAGHARRRSRRTSCAVRTPTPRRR